MQKLDMKKYLANYFALPREGSPNLASTNTKECTERFVDHSRHGMAEAERVAAIQIHQRDNSIGEPRPADFGMRTRLTSDYRKRCVQ